MAKSFRVINSVAPIRINDLGGWTDTWFAIHGKILNIGVYPYVQCQIKVSPRTPGREERVIEMNEGVNSQTQQQLLGKHTASLAQFSVC